MVWYTIQLLHRRFLLYHQPPRGYQPMERVIQMKDSRNNILRVWSDDSHNKSLNTDCRSTKPSLRNKVRHLINLIIELGEHAPVCLRTKIDEIDVTVFDISNAIEGYEIEKFAYSEPGDKTPLNSQENGRCCR